jgi:hypothetical protein
MVRQNHFDLCTLSVIALDADLSVQLFYRLPDDVHSKAGTLGPVSCPVKHVKYLVEVLSLDSDAIVTELNFRFAVIDNQFDLKKTGGRWIKIFIRVRDHIAEDDLYP